MQSLKIWSTFGRGWARRVAHIEAKGVAWALAAANDSHVVKQQLEDEATAAKARSNRQATGAGAAGTTSGGAIVTDQGVQVGDWILAGIAVLAFAALAILIIRAVINAQRAAAYRKELANA
jgi:lysozyme family protein